MIDVKFLFSNFDRKVITATFANINKILIKENLNAIEAKKFKTYANNCNSENSLIAFLILRNYLFIIIIFVKNVMIIMNYVKEFNDKNIVMFKKSNIDVFTAAFKSIVNESFNIFFRQ